MNTNLQTFIQLIGQQSFDALKAHYQQSDDSENLTQLRFLYDQSTKSSEGFELFQQLACQCIETKSLPTLLIPHINNLDTLSFFTPALKLEDNFKLTNQQQRNVLHYLLAGAQNTPQPQHPPFNYLRSMMLFESNEVMHDALCIRDQQNLTPLEVYLFANQNLTALPDHEFSAVLGLIEIESKKQPIEQRNFKPIRHALIKLCQQHKREFSPQLHRLQLLATYYGKNIHEII